MGDIIIYDICTVALLLLCGSSFCYWCCMCSLSGEKGSQMTMKTATQLIEIVGLKLKTNLLSVVRLRQSMYVRMIGLRIL